MITDKQLEYISDWLVITTCHERYSFETGINKFSNCSLKEVLDDYYIYNDDYNKIEKYRDKNFPEENNYLLDLSSHHALDTEYTYTNLKGLPLQGIHLDVMYIIDLNKFDGSESFIWGSTETKFGLIDYKRGEKE